MKKFRIFFEHCGASWCRGPAAFGELAEWSKAADSKSVVPPGYRRFESYALRTWPPGVNASGGRGLSGAASDAWHIKLNTQQLERCPSWSKEHDWKSCVLVRVPRVRIPPSPQQNDVLRFHEAPQFSRIAGLFFILPLKKSAGAANIRLQTGRKVPPPGPWVGPQRIPGKSPANGHFPSENILGKESGAFSMECSGDGFQRTGARIHRRFIAEPASVIPKNPSYYGWWRTLPRFGDAGLFMGIGAGHGWGSAFRLSDRHH